MKKLVIGLTLGMLLGSAATALAATNETVQATFAKFVFKVNGQERQLQTTPLVVDGTSYLPVREVAGLLGYELKYDEATREISLTGSSAKTTEPQPAVSEPKDGENMNTTAPKADGWVSLQEVIEKHGVKVTIDKETVISNGNNTLIFPFGIKTLAGKSTSVPYYFTSESSGATLMISEGSTFIKKDDLKLLGID
ncbi:stalk domain-containing protein [Paenibacillus ehimensis]|uniref:Stalk domain-containing protein n=1 Tax=Paenibacillus ehimensis TaxID=79264 RepID=A0ABT8VLZ1_9BACL|nr:stalk domain-containing protein [Paenibacillus ehimensis]MDO3681977.1 stalk domain-containing protein [Paenibacillus ehimensis]